MLYILLMSLQERALAWKGKDGVYRAVSLGKGVHTSSPDSLHIAQRDLQEGVSQAFDRTPAEKRETLLYAVISMLKTFPRIEFAFWKVT